LRRSDDGGEGRRTELRTNPGRAQPSAEKINLNVKTDQRGYYIGGVRGTDLETRREWNVSAGGFSGDKLFSASLEGEAVRVGERSLRKRQTNEG